MSMNFKLVLGIVIFLGCFSLSQAGTEKYSTERIILGDFKIKDGFTNAGKYSVPWLELETSHVAFDDSHRIYILDKGKKRALQFASEGKLIKEVELSSAVFADKSEELGDDGYIPYQIKVSSDGSYIYVTEGGKENNWAIFDKNGKSIKRNKNHNWLQRRCNDRFRSDRDIVELNNQLEVIKSIKVTAVRQQNEIIDSENNLYSLNPQETNALTKRKADGRQQWKKNISNAGKVLWLLGVDGADCIYVLTDGPMRIIKINGEGEQVALIDVPATPFFKDWRRVSFNVLCDGTVFCVPSHYAVWQELKNSIDGEYMIYKFQKLASDNGVLALSDFFGIKDYDGSLKSYTERDINNLIHKFGEVSKMLSIKAFRNEIYARHGRIFTTPEMKQIFEAAPWYKPRKDFQETDLNEVEKKNVEFIYEYEKKMGWK